MQNTSLIGLAFCLVLLAAAPAPKVSVEPWSPKGISSPQFESHAAFDPLTGDLYFVRSSPEFRGWRIFMSRCTSAGWSAPQSPGFAGDGVEADPFFTADGHSLYFISTRTTDGVKGRGLDLWQVDRGEKGVWGIPERLPAPINSAGQEWFPRPGRDGWLYFGSDRPGGLGLTDIWRARPNGAQGWRVENAGPAINSAGDEYEPLPSPDGKRMIVMAADGLYESARISSGWGPRTRLGPDVNKDANEIGPAFSPSGRTMLFARDTKAPLSGEFFLARSGKGEDWPPACPTVRRKGR